MVTTVALHVGRTRQEAYVMEEQVPKAFLRPLRKLLSWLVILNPLGCKLSSKHWGP